MYELSGYNRWYGIVKLGRGYVFLFVVFVSLIVVKDVGDFFFGGAVA